MKVAAYCRVSTDKQDQLNSLDTQKKFFAEYTGKNGYNLIRIYADEGISGTKIKKRLEFQRLISDAQKGLFDMVVVKDISRFARNTVDFLQSIRTLKALGIETTFLTANMTVLGNSEFVLTIFGALAQEESANMSKRIKFGKKANAEKGKVPNLVYGYDKTIGDYYNLTINEKEAKTIRQIYDWYLEEGYGTSKIANMLNESGIRTKRNCNWSQHAICRILNNKLYIGKVINGKEEIADFLTGVRTEKDEEEWLVTERPDLIIISLEQFNNAQALLKNRTTAFHLNQERQSSKYLFSTLIKCKDCGWSYRRIVRQYKNTYVRWVCSGRNGKGIDSCPNSIVLDEEELVQAIEVYVVKMLKEKKGIIDRIIKEFTKIYKIKSENETYEKELSNEYSKLNKMREKYMDMYTDDLISRSELKEKVGHIRVTLEKLENNLKIVKYNLNKGEKLGTLMRKTFQVIEDINSIRDMTNEQLKQIIQKIEVDKEGNVDIYLGLVGDLSLNETVLLNNNRT
jgi:Site-specific recombinases, DNA invertase Pin homologs